MAEFYIRLLGYCFWSCLTLTFSIHVARTETWVKRHWREIETNFKQPLLVLLKYFLPFVLRLQGKRAEWGRNEGMNYGNSNMNNFRIILGNLMTCLSITYWLVSWHMAWWLGVGNKFGEGMTLKNDRIRFADLNVKSDQSNWNGA